MREVESYDHLKALPFWVVVRTKRGAVRERDPNSGSWSEVGHAHAVAWENEDFPAQVLWSYAEEVDPPLTFSKIGVPTGITTSPGGVGGVLHG